MSTALRSILDSIRQASVTEKDKGTRFEVLVKRYLQTDPIYLERFSEVSLWMDWEYREGFADQGIDLVAKDAVTGGYCAIQCKCYAEGHKIDLKDVSTFFASLNMKWPMEDGVLKHFQSGIIIASTDKWNDKVTRAIEMQAIPCQRVGLTDLEEAPIDWEACAKSDCSEMQLLTKYRPKKHQQEAINDIIKGFEIEERGKLIMACGTGKTFTALRLAEKFTQGQGTVLFLVPSIALLSQSLREWTAQAEHPLYSIAVCSDSRASGVDDSSDVTATDLPSPACTNPQSIAQQYTYWSQRDGMIVVFSTYQSIEVVSKAQELGSLPEFDLIICDEAHRTTGVSLQNTEKKGGYDESAFVRVHDKQFIKGAKRLYMTATPRIYTESSKQKAKESNAVVASMDDLLTYGPEFHRLPFSRAVREDLLTDYKVLVLCVDEAYVKEVFHQELQEEGGQLKLEDAVKLLGCYNGLRKKVLRLDKSTPLTQQSTDVDSGDDIEDDEDSAEVEHDLSTPLVSNLDAEDYLTSDPNPMRRAVAFAGKIKDSKDIAVNMMQMVKQVEEHEGISDDFLNIEINHVDGTMNSQERNGHLAWLKEDAGEKHCRILTNARCLSEGVDVPALDAVMFLSPRRSQVDIVQSVGRVMRKAPGKQYGYIILPIGIPEGKTPEEVLDQDARYGVVWDVLQALRAHDDRFNAEINKIDLNKGRSSTILVAGVTKPKTTPRIGTKSCDSSYDDFNEGDGTTKVAEPEPDTDWLFPIGEWREAILARVVKKCGDRRYWDTWAKDISAIAERQIQAIHDLLDKGEGEIEFEKFLKGLRNNINHHITKAEAVEMLAQQAITRPVFDALFDSYKFAELNPVSRTMNRMLELIHEQTDEQDTTTLKQFYDSVKERAAGIDNAEGKQKIIVELYDKFFKNAFPKMAEKLGIVYTPIEIVDFIIHSVHRILKKEFGCPKGLGEKGVRVLDPFTGTGTFIVRLLQSGLISRRDLKRKYKEELFASEIVLLAYYIACINIEETYHSVMNHEHYDNFEGICLTDTFLMGEKGDILAELFSDNAERVHRLINQDIRVIISNPPYSVGQKSANDNNQNDSYPVLDERIANTYVKEVKATNKNSLYDSYIRAFRWASDRIQEDGVLAFVTNGSFIDNNAMAGFRKTLLKEFSSVYCFNLRGNQRTSGELSRKEGGKIFGSGSRTPVAITILVKKKDHQGDCVLHYHDIGDYLTREQKLDFVKTKAHIEGVDWTQIVPDKHGDWLNHRDEGFNNFIAIGDKETKGKADTKAVFSIFSNGVKTNRDAWVYNFSITKLESQIKGSIEFFNECSTKYDGVLSLDSYIDFDKKKFVWDFQQKKDLSNKVQYIYDSKDIYKSVYRPFVKEHIYFTRQLNNRVYQQPKLFPTSNHDNIVIQLTGNGSTKPFSCLISSILPDLEVISKGQCFPLYWYEKINKDYELPSTDPGNTNEYVRHDAITDYALNQWKNAYGDYKITKEDIFYYIYGLLHSPEYSTRYESDLKKVMPRIPFAKDFRTFCKAGRDLAHWHLNYETVEPSDVVEESHGDYRVEKMKFPKKGVKDIIIYNRSTTLKNIPLEAYDYVVNGKSAIEWIMERYQVKTDKDSGITNDPNDWCKEHNNPRYILDLLKRVIRVSMETNKIVKSLPPIEEIN